MNAAILQVYRGCPSLFIGSKCIQAVSFGRLSPNGQGRCLQQNPLLTQLDAEIPSMTARGNVFIKETRGSVRHTPPSWYQAARRRGRFGSVSPSTSRWSMLTVIQGGSSSCDLASLGVRNDLNVSRSTSTPSTQY